MKQLKPILMAILAVFGWLFALPTSAARRGGDKRGGFNFLPAVCAVCFCAFISDAFAGSHLSSSHLVAGINDISNIKPPAIKHTIHIAPLDGDLKDIHPIRNVPGLEKFKSKPIITGRTALHNAVVWGWTETVFSLVKGGADVFARTSDGKTPLDYAIKYHGKDSVIALFLQGAMEKQGNKNRQKADELLRGLE